eukprot:s2515_g9.t1
MPKLLKRGRKSNSEPPNLPYTTTRTCVTLRRGRRWLRCPAFFKKYCCCCCRARQRESPFQSNREQLQFQQSRRSGSTIGKPAEKSSSNLAPPRRV